MVRMSTTSWLSTQGRLKWRPEGAKAGAKQREIDPYFLLPKMCDDFFLCVCKKKTYPVLWILHLRGDPSEIWQLVRILVPPVREFWPEKVGKRYPLLCQCTLKHTQSENGKVTITMTQEKAVRSHPHIPMPMSPSLAVRESRDMCKTFS